MTEKISIIIPAYNASATIDRCLTSLLNQNIRETYQIIVLNDGSTDNTLTKLEKYKNDKRVTIINKLNTGASDTRNQGLKLVKSEYVTFVDADDYVETDYLESLLKQYVKNNCDLSIVGYYKEDDNKEIRFQGAGEKKNLTQEEALHDIFISTGFEGYLGNKFLNYPL